MPQVPVGLLACGGDHLGIGLSQVPNLAPDNEDLFTLWVLALDHLEAADPVDVLYLQAQEPIEGLDATFTGLVSPTEPAPTSSL